MPCSDGIWSELGILPNLNNRSFGDFGCVAPSLIPHNRSLHFGSNYLGSFVHEMSEDLLETIEPLVDQPCPVQAVPTIPSDVVPNTLANLIASEMEELAREAAAKSPSTSCKTGNVSFELGSIAHHFVGQPWLGKSCGKTAAQAFECPGTSISGTTLIARASAYEMTSSMS
eukprot:CAMPEP_0169169784 /NCGR_PEP_ID=MMETSP1015-20121227/61753_1 /TAXON_ID=342587 /ORGANISM="Karlodinium micrum, Strain CCMP2283" /LENGTH=170 /DNA_ID=CAMNT_0009242711 /DNA_START=403 /DNA_END=913 /DNA_ORIENTATION=+